MELVSLGKEVLQSIAEHAASYRLGQAALRHLDRALWVIEKCARWAVPPPLEQDDERPQPELVRPLPWVFFLMMLIALRVTRESISLVNLVLGKPPLRSADVVTFIQSKRRYLRTLKYQGTRKSRARSSQAAAAPSPSTSWYTSLYSMFELTMCFRRQSHCDNNNTTPVFTRATNNDELVVVKRGREDSSPTSASVPSENTMERLIEKMMVDLDVESDEDSTYTLTNISTSRTDRSDCTLETDQDTVYLNESTPTSKHNGNGTTSNEDIHFSPNTEKDSSTPEKIKKDLSKEDSIKSDTSKDDTMKSEASKDDSIKSDSSKDDSIQPASSKDDSIKSVSRKDDSIKSDTSNNDSFKSDSTKDDSIESVSSKDDSIKSDSSKNDSFKSGSSKDYSIESGSSKDDSIKSDASKTDSIKSDASKTDSIKSGSSKDDSIKSDTSRDESTKPGSIDVSKENSKVENGTEAHNADIFNTDCKTSIPTPEHQLSDKQVTQNFIQNESRAPKKEHKIANGRTVKSVSNKKKGHRERQQSNEVVQPRALTSKNSF